MEDIKWQIFLANNPRVAKMYKKIQDKQKREKDIWWNKTLPRKGSVLRMLVDKQLNEQPNAR